jgi:hypothetical protein
VTPHEVRVGDPQRRETHRPLSREQADFERAAGWWAQLGGKLVAQARLGPADNVISISWRGAEPLVTDGPYVEAKETVGGIIVVDVASHEEAVAFAKSFPNKTGCRIEVRPVLEP